MPFVNAGDLVMITESCVVPVEVSKSYDPYPMDVPEGTVGVITRDCGGGVFSLITGLGLVQVPMRILKRLGKALPDWYHE